MCIESKSLLQQGADAVQWSVRLLEELSSANQKLAINGRSPYPTLSASRNDKGGNGRNQQQKESHGRILLKRDTVNWGVNKTKDKA